jgi:hypothetical protein
MQTIISIWKHEISDKISSIKTIYLNELSATNNVIFLNSESIQCRYMMEMVGKKIHCANY